MHDRDERGDEVQSGCRGQRPPLERADVPGLAAHRLPADRSRVAAAQFLKKDLFSSLPLTTDFAAIPVLGGVGLVILLYKQG